MYAYTFFFSTCLHLHNVLCVPKIITNLISVSKLLTDDNIVIEFSSDACFLKDKVKGTLLAQGIAQDGLYKLLLKEDFISSHHVSTFQSNSIVAVLNFNKNLSPVKTSNNGLSFKSESESESM